jgi:hypothetical protein
VCICVLIVYNLFVQRFLLCSPVKRLALQSMAEHLEASQMSPRDDSSPADVLLGLKDPRLVPLLSRLGFSGDQESLPIPTLAATIRHLGNPLPQGVSSALLGVPLPFQMGFSAVLLGVPDARTIRIYLNSHHFFPHPITHSQRSCAFPPSSTAPHPAHTLHSRRGHMCRVPQALRCGTMRRCTC